MPERGKGKKKRKEAELLFMSRVPVAGSEGKKKKKKRGSQWERARSRNQQGYPSRLERGGEEKKGKGAGTVSVRWPLTKSNNLLGGADPGVLVLEI